MGFHVGVGFPVGSHLVFLFPGLALGVHRGGLIVQRVLVGLGVGLVRPHLILHLLPLGLLLGLERGHVR